MHAAHLLQWYLEAGVDECIEDAPVNRFAVKEPPAQPVVVALPPVTPATPAPTAALRAAFPPPSFAAGAAPLSHSPAAAAAQARQMAESCQTLEELYDAIRQFDGLSIKKSAKNTVIADGNPEARVMVIGEAPGAQEDLEGIPFCGPSGKLLDDMFAAIGLDRQSFYISNTLFWRPPGNRTPSSEELFVCRPFVEKHIALIRPALLVLVGGTAAASLLETTTGITRLRGKQYEYRTPYLPDPIPVSVLFHPSYLLRQPAAKQQAWADLLAMRGWLKGYNIL